jgi:hypothetical protein
MKIKTLKKALFIAIFISSFFVYRSDFLMFKVIDGIDYKTGNIFHLGDIRNSLMNFVDDLNPLKGSVWKENNKLPIINFDLSREQIGEIALTIDAAKKSAPYDLYMPNELNQYLKTDITINGKRYKGKVKLHGTNNPHFINPKKSYSLKISDSKNESLPYNMSKFAVIIPTQSNLVGLYTYKIAELVGMIAPQNFLVRVYINGIDQGIYHLEEKLDKALLERNDLSGYDVVRSDDSWAHQYSNNHGTMFSFEYSGLQQKPHSGKDLDQTVLIKKVINSSDAQFIKQHISIDKFILYDALRYIFGDSAHMTSHDNIKLLYNTSNGRIEPYFRIENHIEKIISNDLTYSPEQHVNFGKYTVNNLLFQLTKDDDYREKRNIKIYELLEKRETILKIYDDILNTELGYLSNDTSNELPSRFFKYEMVKARKNLVHNLEFLKKYLDYSRVFVEFVRKDKSIHEISIIPDSNSPLAASNFIIGVDKSYVGQTIALEDMQTGIKSFIDIIFDDKNNAVINLKDVLNKMSYSLSLDDDLEPSKNYYKFSLFFEGEIISSDIEFYNKLNKKKIISRDIYSIIVDESNLVKHSIPSYIKQLNGNEYHIPVGSVVNVYEDTVLPYGINLRIDKGVKINLNEGASFLVNGSLFINGERNEQVTIKSNHINKKFGSFGVLGDRNSIVEIKFLEIYGGSEDILNGVHLSGALSIHNHDFVSIQDSDIHHNAADDGVNIKNAKINVKNNKFHANKADQIDIDFGIGVVEGNHFSQASLHNTWSNLDILEDNNGDGLDFSGSEVIIVNNKFIGFLDKGMSIGENTNAFISNNYLEENRSGITAKDQSQVYVYNNSYFNNEIDIEMFQKKKIFNHPSVYNMTKNHSDLSVKKTLQSRYFKPKNSEDYYNFNLDTSIFSSLDQISWIEYE